MKCTGCLISSEAPEVSLKPGDHVTITYPEHQYDELVLSVCILCLLFTPCCHVCSDIVHNVCILFIVYSLSCLFVCKQISLVTDHASMATQWDPTLTLQDCIQMFSQKYVDRVKITMVTYCIM